MPRVDDETLRRIAQRHGPYSLAEAGPEMAAELIRWRALGPFLLADVRLAIEEHCDVDSMLVELDALMNGEAPDA